MKIIEILRREIISAMRLVGATNVKDLKPEMVCRLHIDVVARLIFSVGGARRLAIIHTRKALSKCYAFNTYIHLYII